MNNDQGGNRIVFVATLLFVLLAASVGLFDKGDSPKSTQAATTSVVSLSSASAGTPSGSASQLSHPSATAGNEPPDTARTAEVGGGPWLSFAVEFAGAWNSTEGTDQAWLTRLRPMVTPDLAQSLSTVDRSRLPGGRINGARVVLLDDSGAGCARISLTESAVPGLDVWVARRGANDWVVSRVDPAAGA